MISALARLNHNQFRPPIRLTECRGHLLSNIRATRNTLERQVDGGLGEARLLDQGRLGATGGKKDFVTQTHTKKVKIVLPSVKSFERGLGSNSPYHLSMADGDEALRRYTGLAFSYADTCLKLGKLDRADSTYRDVIGNLIGAAYGGYRDRAKVGLDDVRAARALAQSK